MLTRGTVTWISTESDSGKTVVVLEDETTRMERAIGVLIWRAAMLTRGKAIGECFLQDICLLGG